MACARSGHASPPAPYPGPGPCLGCRAFSLLELVFVLMLVAIASALAVPRLTSSQSAWRVSLAARRVAADLALARDAARAASASRAVEFDTATGSYRLTGVPSRDRPGSDYAVSLAADPFRTRIVSASFAGLPRVVFNGYGQPSASGSVTLVSAGMIRIVELDRASGIVRVR